MRWLTVEMCDIQGATDKEKRDIAKEVNYGILFQMTATGLTKKLGTGVPMALMSLSGDLRQRKMKIRVVIVLHDAIWAEAPAEEAEKAKRLLVQSMKDAVEYTYGRLEVEFD